MQAIISSGAAAAASAAPAPRRMLTNLPQDVVAEIFSYLTPKEQCSALVNKLTYECFKIPRRAILERIWRESMSEEGLSIETVIASWSLPTPKPLLVRKTGLSKFQIRQKLVSVEAEATSFYQKCANLWRAPESLSEDQFDVFYQRWTDWVWKHRFKVQERRKEFSDLKDRLYRLNNKCAKLVAPAVRRGDYDHAVDLAIHATDFHKMPLELLQDREFVKLVLSQWGLRLEDFPSFLDDLEMVKIATMNDAFAFRDASEDLKDDPAIVEEMLATFPRAIFSVDSKFLTLSNIKTAFSNWKKELRYCDIQLMKELYTNISEKWSIDGVDEEVKREFIAMMLSIEGTMLSELSEFQDDEEMVIIAVSEVGVALKWVSERLRDNPKVVKSAVRYLHDLEEDEPVISFASKRLQKDPEIKQLVKKACRLRPNNHLPVRIRDNRDQPGGPV